MININKTYRFLALCLVVLVFLSSAGFTIDMHYCNNELKSISLIGKAKPCHEPTLKQCPFHKKMQEKSAESSKDAKGCCENKTEHFQSDQDQQIQNIDFKLSQPIQLFITAFITNFISNNGFEKELIVFTRYRPPIIQKDIPVLIQSFLL